MTASFRFSIILLFVFLLANICSAQKSVPATDATKKEAERIWELAIQAKGGREKLYKAKNMVVISNSQVRYSMLKSYTHKVESLSVFPDKIWIWDDNRPSVFGLDISMYNYQEGMKYYLNSNSESNNLNLVPFEKNEKKNIGKKMPGSIYDLLETYWLKPLPQKLTRGKVNSKTVDIVQTEMGGERFDFAFDNKTHLLLRVTYYYFEPISKKNLINELNLSDYKNFDGIMMPTKRKHSNENGVETLSYQFNVEYNEDIFNKPPPFEAGAEAWKATK
jgi:hypothetical protein